MSNLDIESWLCQEIAAQFEVAKKATHIAGDGLLWTRISDGDWAIEVCNHSFRPVRIAHMPCFEQRQSWMWWGPNFRNSRQTCWDCGTMIPAKEEDYLLKAWELYSA